MRILLVDNFDSFTYNLASEFGQLGAEVIVMRNSTPLAEALAVEPDAVVISPGPGHPKGSRLALEILRSGIEKPILGVCLGHQAIGEAFGGKIVKAGKILHGKSSAVLHSGNGLFSGIPSPFEAVRYHSLVVERDSLPSCLEVVAETAEGEIMGLQHRERKIFGVQFHPESILTRGGKRILKNFFEMAAPMLEDDAE